MAPPRDRSIKKLFFLIPILTMGLSLTRCASGPELFFTPGWEKQPYVMTVSPENFSSLNDPIEFELKFSHRIDFAKVNPDSVALLSGPLSKELRESVGELTDQLISGDLSQHPLEYILAEDETTLWAFPQADLEPGIYHLVVTPRLNSIQGFPFNQNPGQNPEAFIATFAHGVNLDHASLSDGLGELSPTFGPVPESLVIHELRYDGLASETDGDAFVELYGTPGSDISGYEISLINGANGEETERITLPDGAQVPEEGIFVIADLRTNSTISSQVEIFHVLDQFDPQNGPDAIQLKDRAGKILDALAYGEGGVSTTPAGLPLGEGSPATDVPPGHSLSRTGGMDTQDNQADFSDLSGPSPGIL